MSEEQSSELIDFDFDSDKVEVGYPKIAAGVYPFEIIKTYTKDSASGGKNLVVEVANAKKMNAITKDPPNPGRELDPGTFVLRVYCPMADVGKMKPGQFMERLTEIHRACGLTGKISTGDWQHKVVAVKVVMEPARKVDQPDGSVKEYDEANSAKSFMPYVEPAVASA